MRDVQLFLLFECLEAVIRLLVGQISMLWRRGKVMGEWWSEEQSEHRHLPIKFVILYGCSLCVVRWNNYSSNPKDHWSTDHHDKYSNSEKFEMLWEMWHKGWHKDMEQANEVGKIAPADLLNTGLPQNSIRESTICAKCNKMSYACNS